MKTKSYRYRLAKARQREIDRHKWYRLSQELRRVLEKPNS